MAPLVVGFDLDLTLIDSRPGITATYQALSARTGVYIDAEAAANRLGPPLDVELALWFAPDDIATAGDLYRELYPTTAIDSSPATPGATAAVAAVRAYGGGVVVITGKFEPNARLHLAHLDLEVDEVVGWAWAEGKVTAMLAHGVGIYVGDHPADMAAAKEAGALAVGVLTGEHAPTELTAAGADVVLENLTGFPPFLDAYVGEPEISVGLSQSDR